MCLLFVQFLLFRTLFLCWLVVLSVLYFIFYFFRLITILIVSFRTELDDAWDFLAVFSVRIHTVNSVLTWWRRSFRNVECSFSSTKFLQTRSVSICTHCCISLLKSSPNAPTHPLQSPRATPAPDATKYLTPHHLPLSLPDLLSLVRSLPVTGAVAAQVLPSRSLSPLRYCVKTLPTCAHNIFGHLWNFTRRRTRSCRAFRRSSPSSSSPRWQLLYYLLEKECQVGISLVEEVFRVVSDCLFQKCSRVK